MAGKGGKVSGAAARFPGCAVTQSPLIPAEIYRQFLNAMPVMCVDLVIRVPDGRFLLLRRANEPLKGEWWVVGGRLRHGERAVDGARRKLREETGIDVPAESLRCVGFYEDQFDRNALAGEAAYHTVALVFEVVLAEPPRVRLDGQSDEWQLADRLPPRFAVTSFEPGGGGKRGAWNGR